MALAGMEAEVAYREQLAEVFQSLAELKLALWKVERTEDSEGLRPLQDFGRQLREVEDRLRALHLCFSLQRSHAGEDLARVRRDLRDQIAGIAAKLKESKEAGAGLLKRTGEKILKASELAWDAVATFFQYEESDEQRRAREEMEKKVID
jgi:hypothetical protein